MGRGNHPWKKNKHFVLKTDREAYVCDWSPGHEPRFQFFFESGHGSMLHKIRWSGQAMSRCTIWRGQDKSDNVTLYGLGGVKL